MKITPETDFEQLNSILSSVDWQNELNVLNTDDSWSRFKNTLEEAQQECYETGQLFTAPTDLNSLSAGLGRHWPDGRGKILENKKNTLR